MGDIFTYTSVLLCFTFSNMPQSFLTSSHVQRHLNASLLSRNKTLLNVNCRILRLQWLEVMRRKYQLLGGVTQRRCQKGIWSSCVRS